MTHRRNPLDNPVPRTLIAAAIIVPLLMLVLLAAATLLPYPPDPTVSILHHLTGW